VLTPHPAEAARLLGCTTADVQADRIAAACRLAGPEAWVVLKGCGSIVASPDGHWWINTSGNPAMATAGMGDVLSGILAALLARGWEPARRCWRPCICTASPATACAPPRAWTAACSPTNSPRRPPCFNGWIKRANRQIGTNSESA
jgi:NAD(P)H-hydrate repair Nnr-like enzyme with NAD(P)H-hydrate dehydratase domain